MLIFGFRCQRNPNYKIFDHRLITIYRAHQIANNFTMSYFRYIVLGALTFSACVMISMMNALICFSLSLGPFSLIAVSTTCCITFIITGICLHFAYNLTKASKEFSLSYLKSNIKLNKVIRRRLNASKPLVVEIGKLEKVKGSTFLNFMNNIVISNLITLILMQKKKLLKLGLTNYLD